MSKTSKIWLIAAAFAIFSGLIIFTVLMATLGWDFQKISGEKFETNTHTLSEDYSDIFIDTNTAEIIILPSDSKETKIVCYERMDAKHFPKIQDGTLTLELIETGNWLNRIIGFCEPTLTLYVPKGEYSNLRINSSTGDIKISEGYTFGSIDIEGDTCNVSVSSPTKGDVKISVSTGDITLEKTSSKNLLLSASTGTVAAKNTNCENMDISVSTGDVYISNVIASGDVTADASSGDVYLTNLECKNLNSEAKTGDIILSSTVASGKFTIERSTGDVTLDRCDASEIMIKTDTGDVSGSIISEKVFIVTTSTGDADYPKTTTGGICEITTSTGDVEIEYANTPRD